MVDTLPELGQESVIYPVIHVAEHDIRLGAVPGMVHFHAELIASDPSSDQRGVKDNGFHKSILGAPQHLILLRLLHASGRIAPGVDQKTFIIALDKKGEHT